ncbi:hypothetical protein RCL1_008938 [Eukaryota sp. TZLM3-RCL]
MNLLKSFIHQFWQLHNDIIFPSEFLNVASRDPSGRRSFIYFYGNHAGQRHSNSIDISYPVDILDACFYLYNQALSMAVSFDDATEVLKQCLASLLSNTGIYMSSDARSYCLSVITDSWNSPLQLSTRFKKYWGLFGMFLFASILFGFLIFSI